MRDAIGALVVGYYNGDRFVYAGRIGTGYTQAVARDLWKRLHALERDTPPFDEIPREQARRRDVRWVEPKMVIESHFRGWTADTWCARPRSRACARTSRRAKSCIELPARCRQSSRVSFRSGQAGRRRTRPKRPIARPCASPIPIACTGPDVGVTKQNLADYYRAVWPSMAPHLVNRPLALVRCPDGTKGECFFQKHASAGLTEQHLKTVIDKNRRQIIAVEDLEGLLSLVQAGVLEVHVRGSLIDRLDLCDRIVFDMDPGPDLPWAAVVAAARDVRERLAGIDLVSFVKLTGGKGLHVVLPIEAVDWDTAKTFAQAVALAMHADSPDRYVVKITKSLRKGKILVDYLRNSLEQTAVAAYSTRARDGAPVSVPVSWDELSRTKAGNQYTVSNLERRLKNPQIRSLEGPCRASSRSSPTCARWGSGEIALMANFAKDAITS